MTRAEVVAGAAYLLGGYTDKVRAQKIAALARALDIPEGEAASRLDEVFEGSVRHDESAEWLTREGCRELELEWFQGDDRDLLARANAAMHRAEKKWVIARLQEKRARDLRRREREGDEDAAA